MSKKEFSYYKVAMYYLNNIADKLKHEGDISHFRVLMELYGESGFNDSYDYALSYSECDLKKLGKLSKDDLENIFISWHKMFRQIDACDRFTQVDTKDGDSVSLNGFVDRLFYTYVMASAHEIPYKTMKFVLKSESEYHNDPTEVEYML